MMNEYFSANLIKIETKDFARELIVADDKMYHIKSELQSKLHLKCSSLTPATVEAQIKLAVESLTSKYLSWDSDLTYVFAHSHGKPADEEKLKHLKPNEYGQRGEGHIIPKLNDGQTRRYLSSTSSGSPLLHGQKEDVLCHGKGLWPLPGLH